MKERNICKLYGKRNSVKRRVKVANKAIVSKSEIIKKLGEANGVDLVSNGM